MIGNDSEIQLRELTLIFSDATIVSGNSVPNNQ
jgi:hypothetical protein